MITDELKRREQSGENSRALLEADLETARRGHKNLEAELRKLAGRMASVSDDIWEIVAQEMESKRRLQRQFETTIKEMESQLAADFNAVNALSALTDYCQRVKINLASFGFNERRLALEALGVKVTGNGYEWRLDFNIPLAGYSPTSRSS